MFEKVVGIRKSGIAQQIEYLFSKIAKNNWFCIADDFLRQLINVSVVVLATLLFYVAFKLIRQRYGQRKPLNEKKAAKAGKKDKKDKNEEGDNNAAKAEGDADGVGRDEIANANEGAKAGKKKTRSAHLEHDYTVHELREFDGRNDKKHILVGVHGKVYDVSKHKKFFGPGGPYAAYAGRDASRNLATFKMDVQEHDDVAYDNLEDLTELQRRNLCDWAKQFSQKYKCVGRLVRGN